MKDNAIDIQNLNKTYNIGSKQEKVALSDIDFSVKKGSFTALLGPNGAGKSTLINILSSTVNKTSGKIIINGYDLDKKTKAAKRSMGVVPQEIVMDPFFNPYESIYMNAGFYGVKVSKDEIYDLLERLELKGKEFVPTRQLSGGMKRRVLIAKAMIHKPEILILDEPTAGVDVSLRRSMWEEIVKLNAQGTTILLTTHYLEEAQELCDNIVIINEGRIIANDNKKHFIKSFGNSKLVVHLQNKLEEIPANLKNQFSVELINKKTLQFAIESGNESGNILYKIMQEGLHILNIETKEEDLEKIFLKLTQ